MHPPYSSLNEGDGKLHSNLTEGVQRSMNVKNTKWYYSESFIIIMLVTFYPLGFLLLQKSDCIKRKMFYSTLFFYIYTIVFVPITCFGLMIFLNFNANRAAAIIAISIMFAVLLTPLIIIIDIVIAKTGKPKINNLYNENKQVMNRPIKDYRGYAAPQYNQNPTQNYYGYYNTNKVWQQTNIPQQSRATYYTPQNKKGYIPPQNYTAPQSIPQQAHNLQNPNYNMDFKTQNSLNDNTLPLTEEKTNYKKASLLTSHELSFYSHLRVFAEDYNYNVLSKIRLADIVNVNDEIYDRHDKDWWSHFGKIKSKHIDFALANKETLAIQLLIELDDSTHYRNDRIQRDEFVDSVCIEAGIPIIHIRNTANLEKVLVEKLFGF